MTEVSWKPDEKEKQRIVNQVFMYGHSVEYVFMKYLETKKRKLFKKNPSCRLVIPYQDSIEYKKVIKELKLLALQMETKDRIINKQDYLKLWIDTLNDKQSLKYFGVRCRLRSRTPMPKDGLIKDINSLQQRLEELKKQLEKTDESMGIDREGEE